MSEVEQGLTSQM